MIALMSLNGEYDAWAGPMKPSNEWRLHLDLARARPDVGAIVRCQSPYATALAMANKSIPAAHSAFALFGSPVIRCAKYAPAGTKELAVLAHELGEGHADAGSGARRAIELESLSRLYAIALSVERPAIL
jgi:L-fuculose-phosphate aldolase